MRLVPDVEGRATWQDVALMLLWGAAIFGLFWSVDRIESWHAWKQIAGLPWWWRLSINFFASTVFSAVIIGYVQREHGRANLSRFALGVLKVASIPGAVTGV